MTVYNLPVTYTLQERSRPSQDYPSVIFVDLGFMALMGGLYLFQFKERKCIVKISRINPTPAIMP